MLLERRAGARDRSFDGVVDAHPESEQQVLAELELAAVPARGRLVVAHPPVDELLGGRRDDALDAVTRHEVEPPRAAAHDRLPGLDRQARGTRHQRDLLQLIAAIRNLRRNRVVLALVGERLLVERFQDDLHLLLEELAIGFRVQNRVAERLHLARVVAAPDAEDEAASRQDVRGRIVLGEPQRVPRGNDVERAADLDVLGPVRQVDRHHRNVRQALVALVLEVMLGEPEDVVSELVDDARELDGRVEHLDQSRVRIPPIVGRGAREPAPFELDVADVERRELRDHPITSGKRLLYYRSNPSESASATKFASCRSISLVSWVRFKISQSSRSAVITSNSASVVATASAERGAPRNSAISPNSSPSPSLRSTRADPFMRRRISTVPA